MMRMLAAISLLCTGVVAAAGDWPQFLGPNRNGEAPGEAILDRFPDGGPPVLWKIKIGEGYSGPIVVGDRVVVFHQVGGKETLECLGTKDGKSVWKVGYLCDYQGGYGTGPGPRGTPCSVDGVVYSFGATATLQAVELSSGRLLWRRELQREFQVPEGYFGVGTSPLIDGDKLLVTVGAKKASLVAFDPKTGKAIWSATEDQASYASPTVATVGGKPYALFFARSGLHVVDPSTGRVDDFLRWRSRMDASVNAATPIVVGNQIFVSAEYGTGAVLLNLAGGKLSKVWASQDGMTNHYNTCVHRDGYLYGIDGRQEFGAKLRCTKLATGDPAWSEEGFGCAAVLLVGSRLLMWTESGEIVLADADPTQYREISRFRIGRPESRAYPALSNGVFYVRTPDQLVAIDLRP